MYGIENAVYIGRDIELVFSDFYAIAYRRSDAGDFLESRLYAADAGLIGICKTNPARTERGAEPTRWQSAFVFHGEARATDAQMRACVGGLLDVRAIPGGVRASFGDGIVYEATLDERLETPPPAPAPTADTVGECWLLWNMGVRELRFRVDGRETFIGVAIDTRRHMYIFEMTPGSIYCRCARFASTNRGVVFNQNFRQGGEAYMIEDNRIAREPLPIDESRFRTDACFWDDRSVYWSLVSFTDDEILLNGCNGAVYRAKRPTAS